MLAGVLGASLGLHAAAPANTSAASAATPPRTLAVTAPAVGAAVPAATYGADWAVPIEARGTAPRGRRVELTVPCGTSTCTSSTVADRAGRWRAGIDAVVSSDTALLRLTVRELAARTPVVRTRSVRVRGPVVPAGEAPASLVMTGDSLAVGTAAPLAGALPGWSVSTQARVGRRLAAGMSLFGATTLPSGPLVVAFSLFTNDDPLGLPELEGAVLTSLARVGARGCAIWATITRPAVGGRGYAAVNRRLRELTADPVHGGRLRLVDWSREYARHASWRAKDRVHATPAGYRARAALFAAQAQQCPAVGETPVAPRDPSGPGGVEAPGR